jgi:hypothetical protein
VDDTGLCVTSDFDWNPNLSDKENQMEEARHVLQKLNLQKSFWYLITWTWRNGIPCLSTIAQQYPNPVMDVGLQYNYWQTPLV